MCVDTIGSYVCICDEGYIANNSRCDGNEYDCGSSVYYTKCYNADINECSESNGGCSQFCVNTIGSFMCNCSAGYELVNDTMCIGELYAA